MLQRAFSIDYSYVQTKIYIRQRLKDVNQISGVWWPMSATRVFLFYHGTIKNCT